MQAPPGPFWPFFSMEESLLFVNRRDQLLDLPSAALGFFFPLALGTTIFHKVLIEMEPSPGPFSDRLSCSADMDFYDTDDSFVVSIFLAPLLAFMTRLFGHG